VNKKRSTLVTIFAGLIGVCFSIYACSSGHDAHPASSLQSTLASRLENPDLCPTGTSQDVQQIVNSAGSDGVVSIPEGCYRMTATVNIPGGIELVGAGVDKTILYRDPDSTYWQPILQVRGDKDAPGGTHISGMAFIGVRDSNDIGQDSGVVILDVMNFRVDHCYFEGFGWAGVRVLGSSSGVIDHAIFVDNYKVGIDNLGYGVGVYGEDKWATDLHIGGAQGTFVEDSLFIGNRHAIAASAGAHYIFRYNHVLHGIVACAVDAHGMGYGNARGTRFVEIYQNVIEEPIYHWCGIGIRGGSGVIFENTIRDYKNPILLILEWGTPNSYKSKYPAFYQVQELYIWDNKITGGPSEPQVDETGVDFIKAGRDYFTKPMPGYVPYVYPHPLTGGGPFDNIPWPPSNK
jgi:Right handed beta helix region